MVAFQAADHMETLRTVGVEISELYLLQMLSEEIGYSMTSYFWGRQSAAVAWEAIEMSREEEKAAAAWGLLALQLNDNG